MTKIPRLPSIPAASEPELNDMDKLKRLASLMLGLTEDECDEDTLHLIADKLKEASIVGPTWGPWDMSLEER